MSAPPGLPPTGSTAGVAAGDGDGHDMALAQLTAERDAARIELQEFIYAVSHDLRAPLRHINAFAQIIEEDLVNMPADIASHLATIRQSAQLLTQQLDGLTQLSRLAQQVVHLAPVETAGLVHSVVDELTAAAPQRVLHWQIAADLPVVWADADLLRQVLTQVLDNACKFTRRSEPAQISVAWSALADGRCAISVQDNGVGFRADQAGQLFRVFARLHPVREFEGLGLGLLQCRRMLARIGADISITGAPGAGCQVRLTLPM